MKKMLILFFVGFVFTNNSFAMENDRLDLPAIQSNVNNFFVPEGMLFKDFILSKPEAKNDYYLSRCFCFFIGYMRKYESCLSTFTENILLDYNGLIFTPEIYETFKFYFQILFKNKDINFEIVDFNCVKAINFKLEENSIVFSDFYKN